MTMMTDDDSMTEVNTNFVAETHEHPATPTSTLPGSGIPSKLTQETTDQLITNEKTPKLPK